MTPDDIPPTAPWSATPPAPTAPTRSGRPSAGRWIGAIVAAVVIAVGSAGLGRVAASEFGGSGSSNDATASTFRPAGSGQLPSLGGSGDWSDGGSGSSGSGSGASSSIDVDGIASSASPAIVNIASTLDGGEAAGTGMVISSDGLVLTNNHVIEGSEKLQVEIGVTGKTYDAKVVGYDVADDVALIKLVDASNMKTVKIGDPSSVSVNDAVVAIGNAQGKFGDPTVVSGYVSDTAKTITAGDGGSDSETLHDMIEVQADIQSGDSGGPLLDADGEVVGINTAADVGGGSYGFGGGSSGFGSDSGSASGGTGYAIPIDRAVQIAKQIQSGDESDGVYVGSQKAMLGVALDTSGRGSQGFGGFDSSGDTGAVVSQVQSGSAADDAGIAEGDTITAIDGHRVGTTDSLRTAMRSYHPGDSVRVDWVDSSGSSHHATVTFDAGPPA